MNLHTNIIIYLLCLLPLYKLNIKILNSMDVNNKISYTHTILINCGSFFVVKSWLNKMNIVYYDFHSNKDFFFSNISTSFFIIC